MKRKIRETLKKLAILIVGIGMITAIVILTSARVQSRFVEYAYNGAPVFVDKYIPKKLAKDFALNMQGSTAGFLERAGLLTASPANGPVAYFAADRHYGVVSADDPLVKRRLQGRPSSDFALFRSISTNFYANELVSRSVAAQDGSYVFVNLDEHWRASLLHSYVHAISASNAPARLTAAFRLDQGFDPDLRFAFRFVDETFALFSSDLLELETASGSLETAWATFPEASASRYQDPASDVLVRELEIMKATYDMPQKTAEFYAACNSFASWLLKRYGQQIFCSIASNFLNGTYSNLEEAFAPAGGLSQAIISWKGDASVPI
jgi:hypothetical protein